MSPDPVDPLVFCTCTWSTVNTATVDPPHMIARNLRCPIHGELQAEDIDDEA